MLGPQPLTPAQIRQIREEDAAGARRMKDARGDSKESMAEFAAKERGARLPQIRAHDQWRRRIKAR